MNPFLIVAIVLLSCGIPFLTVGMAQGTPTFLILGAIFAASGSLLLVLGLVTKRQAQKG